jgi:very-short-patch-repair endonuclease
MLTAMANANARALRIVMTDAERRLWSLLRDRRLEGYKFRRQRPIGPFIADFACITHRLVVEADGDNIATARTMPAGVPGSRRMDGASFVSGTTRSSPIPKVS